MLDAPDLSDTDKTEVLLQMFYVRRPENPPEALQAFVAFGLAAYPIHHSGVRSPSVTTLFFS